MNRTIQSQYLANLVHESLSRIRPEFLLVFHNIGRCIIYTENSRGIFPSMLLSALIRWKNRHAIIAIWCKIFRLSILIGRTARGWSLGLRPSASSSAVELRLFTPFQAPLALRLSRAFEPTPPFGRLRSAWFLSRKFAFGNFRTQKRRLNSWRCAHEH